MKKSKFYIQPSNDVEDLITMLTGVSVLTPGAAVALDATKGSVFTLVPGVAPTISCAAVGQGSLFIVVTTSGTSTVNVTFGTGFTSTGVLATGTVDAKTFVLHFVSNGTKYVEVSRTTAM